MFMENISFCNSLRYIVSYIFFSKCHPFVGEYHNQTTLSNFYLKISNMKYGRTLQIKSLNVFTFVTFVASCGPCTVHFLAI